MTPLMFVAVLQMTASQQTPLPSQAPQADDVPSMLEEVVVNGTRPDVRVEIDRRVYRVTDDPQVQTATTLDLLAKIPSVAITPNGRVQLLGNPGVAILIDGNRPANADASLRSMLASQIDRIEVMTNPSAQYSAQGTAGVINIITQRRLPPGLTGTVSLSGNTLGGGQLSFSPSLSRGRWNVEGSVALARQRGESSGSLYRAQGDQQAVPVRELRQADRVENTEDRIRASSRILYRAGARDTVSLSAEVVSRRNERYRMTETSGFERYVERAEAPDHSDGANASLSFEHMGGREGETLKASASVDYLDWTLENRIFVDFEAGGIADRRYITQARIDNQNAGLKVDYVRPFGTSVTFTAGVSWDGRTEDTAQSLNILQGGAPAPESSSALKAERNLGALYGTVQFPFGQWTVKPGLRVEANNFEVRSAGLSTQTQDVALFPSVFFSRKLSDEFSINLSYSRRTNRPDAQRLNPYIAFSSETTAQTGNPDLKPETTNAFEARFDYVRQTFRLGVTLYDRETIDAWSQTTRLYSDPVFLTTYINTGERAERGAEFSIRGSVGAQWKYTSTINLFSNRQDVFDGRTVRTSNDFAYTVNSQLEYKTSPPNGRLPDEFQLLLRYFGPLVFYDNRASPFTQVDLTWRRPLNEAVSFVLTASDLLNSSATRTRLTTQDLREVSDSRGAGTVLRAALTYRFK